ncbi:hypothetical protein ACFX19_028749 [Malus domestica]
MGQTRTEGEDICYTCFIYVDQRCADQRCGAGEGAEDVGLSVKDLYAVDGGLLPELEYRDWEATHLSASQNEFRSQLG